MTASHFKRLPIALTRRSALTLGITGLVLPRILLSGAHAALQDTETHGLSIFGDLAMPADFSHFPYANPDAPKGQIALQLSSTSGNQNPLPSTR